MGESLQASSLIPSTVQLLTDVSIATNSKRSASHRTTFDHFQSKDISDITLEIEKLGKLGTANPECAIKDTNRLIKEIDQQMEMSFEIMEERQSMVLEYLREREMADMQSRGRADLIMEHFTTNMNVIDDTFKMLTSAKSCTSTLTQTNTVFTENREIQTTLSASEAPQSKEYASIYVKSSVCSAIQNIRNEEATLSNNTLTTDSTKSNTSSTPDTTLDDNLNKTKDNLSLIVSSSSSSGACKKNNMVGLRSLCRNMDNLEASLETNMMKIKDEIKPNEAETAFDSINQLTTLEEVDKMLKRLVKEKVFVNEDTRRVKQLIVESVNSKKQILYHEGELKKLLRRKFSQCTINMKPRQQHQQQISSTSNDDDINSATSVENTLSSYGMTQEVTASKSFFKTEFLNKLDAMLGSSNDEKAVEVLKVEKTNVEQQLKNISKKKIKLSKVIEKLKFENNELLREKVHLKKQLKNVNKTISENLLYNGREEERGIAENRLIEIDRHIESLETKLSLSNAGVSERMRTMMVDEENNEHLNTYLKQLRENLNQVLPYVNKMSPKYRNHQPVQNCPTSQQITDIIQTRSELSQQLLQTESQIQLIITSQEYPSNDDISITTEGLSTSHKTSIETCKKSLEVLSTTPKGSPKTSKVRDEVVQLELQIFEINSKINSSNGGENLAREVDETRKMLLSIQNKIKISSQIPRPIEENKQLRVIKDGIEVVKSKCVERGITNFNVDKTFLNDLKDKQKKYKEKINQIKHRIDSENVDGKNIGDVLKDVLQERNRLKACNFNIREDIENLNMVHLKSPDNIKLIGQLEVIESKLIEKKTCNLFTMLNWTANQIDEFTSSIQSNLDKTIKKCIPRDLDVTSQADISELKERYLRNKHNIEELTFELNEINTVSKTKVVSNHINGNMKQLLNQKLEHETVVNQLKESIEAKISTAYNKESLKQLLRKKIQTNESLTEVNDKIDAQSFLLKEKMKKYTKVKSEIELHMNELIDVNDLKKLKEKLHAYRSKKDVITPIISERESLRRNILHAIKQKDNEREKIRNMEKVLDSMDVIIANKLQTLTKQLNCLSAYVSNFAVVLLEVDGIEEILQYQFELQHVLMGQSSVTINNKTTDEKALQQDSIQDLEVFRSLLEDFHERKLDVSHIDQLKQLQSLNEEKLNLLLGKTKSLNALLKTQRKVKDRKLKKLRNSPNDVKILQNTSHKISRELENLVRSFIEDLEENEKVFEGKQILSCSEIKDRLNLLLRERDINLTELFCIEKSLEKMSVDSGPVYNELLLKKERVTRQVEMFDKKIIEGDFSASSEYETPAGRSFSPKSTSSRNSFVVALDDRDRVFRRLYELNKIENNLKTNACAVDRTVEMKDIQLEKDNLQNQLKEIDERIMEGASFEEDDTLNSTLVPSSKITNETLIREIKTTKEELEGGKLKLYGNGFEENGIDIKELITDVNEKELFRNLDNINEELQKQRMKIELRTLENEKIELEESLRGRKSPDRMLLKREEQDVLNLLSEKEDQLMLYEERKVIEGKLNDLQFELQQSELEFERVEERKYESFVKTEQQITVKNYKKDKISLEKRLDEICFRMSEYASSMKDEIERTEEKLKSTGNSDLDTLKNQQTDLREQIANLTRPNLLKNDEKSVEMSLKQRADILLKIDKINKVISEEEGVDESVIEQHLQSLQRYTKKENKLKTKIEIIESRINKCKRVIEETNLHVIKQKLGKQLWDIFVDKSNPDNPDLSELRSELKEGNIFEYIKKLKVKIDNLDELNILYTRDLEEANKKLNSATHQFQELKNETENYRELAEEEITSMKEQLDNFRGAVTTCKEELENQKRNEKELQVNLNRQAKQLEEYVKTIAKLTQNNETLKISEEKYATDIKELKLQLPKGQWVETIEQTQQSTNREISVITDAFAIKEISFRNTLLNEDNISQKNVNESVIQKEISYKNSHQPAKTLLKASEDREIHFFTLEIENKKLKTKVDLANNNEIVYKNTINELQDTCSKLRETNKLFMNDVDFIETKTESFQIELNVLIDATCQTNTMIKTNDPLTKFSESSNVLLKQLLSDQQEEVTCFNERFNRIKITRSQLKEGKRKMESLWKEIIGLKLTLQKQKENDRNEKEQLLKYIQIIENENKVRKREIFLNKNSEHKNMNNKNMTGLQQQCGSEMVGTQFFDDLDKLNLTDLDKKQMEDRFPMISQQHNELCRNQAVVDTEMLTGNIVANTTEKHVINELSSKVLELQKLNVMLEMKLMFSKREVKHASEIQTSRNRVQYKLEDMNKRKTSEQLEGMLEDKEVRIEQLSQEVDRYRRILFKRSHLKVVSQPLQPADKKIDVKSISQAKTEEVAIISTDRRNTSKDVGSALENIVQIVADSIPAEAVTEQKISCPKVRKEKLIEQEIIADHCMSDTEAMNIPTKQFAAIQAKENNAYEKEIEKLKLQIVEHVKEKEFSDSDINNLERELKQLDCTCNQFKLKFDDAEKLKIASIERNIYLETEVAANAKTITCLNEKLEELRDHMFSLEEEIMELEEKYDTIKNTNIGLEKTNAGLQFQLGNQDTLLSKHIHNEEKLQNENQIKTKEQDEMIIANNELNAKLKSLTLSKKSENEKLNESMETIESLKKQLERTENEVRKCKGENDQLQLNMSEVVARLHALTNEIDQNEDTIKSLQLEETGLNKKIMQLEKDKILLDNKLSAEFEEKENTLKELHASLKYALSSKSNIIENNNNTQKKLEEKNHRLKEELKSLQTRIDQLNDIKKENEEFMNRVSAQEKEIEDTHVEINDLKEENFKVSNEIIDLNKTIFTLRSKLAKLEATCGNDLMNILTEDGENVANTGVAMALPHVTHVKNMLSENKSLDVIITRLYEESEVSKEELEALKEDLNASKEEFEASKKQLKTSNEELKATKEEIEGLKTYLQDTNVRQENNMTMLKNENERLNVDIKDLETKLQKEFTLTGELRKELSYRDDEMESKDQAITGLSEREDILKVETCNTLKELNLYVVKLNKADNQVMLLRSDIDEKNKAIEINEAEINQFKIMKKNKESEITELSKEKNILFNENNKIKNNLLLLQDNMKSNENERMLLTNEIDFLQHEIKQINRESDTLQNRNKTLQSQLGTFEEKNELLTENENTYVDNIKSMKKEQSRLDAKNESLNLNLSKQESTVENLSIRNETLLNEVKGLKFKEKNQEKLIERLQNEADLQKQNTEANETVIKNFKETMYNLKAINQTLSEDQILIKSENKANKDRNIKLDNEIETLRNNIKNLTSNKHVLQTQVETLNRQIQKLSRNREVLNEEIDKESRLNETYEDDIFNLNLAIKTLRTELNTCLQTIDQQNEALSHLEKEQQSVNYHNVELKKELEHMNSKYDQLLSEHQLKTSCVNKELSLAKNRVDQQRLEIQQLNEQSGIKEELKDIKTKFENEKRDQDVTICELKETLESLSKKDDEACHRLVERKRQVSELETKCNELQVENDILIQKLKELDETYEQEISETRRQLTDKYKKNIDKLSLKSRNLSNEIIDMENLKNQVEKDRNKLVNETEKLRNENRKLSKKLQDKLFHIEEKERYEQIRLSTHHYEVEGLTLENNDLIDQLKNLKYQINKNDMLKNYEIEIAEQKRQLEMSMKVFAEEKITFESNIKDMLTKKLYSPHQSEVEIHNMCREEKNKLSIEVIDLNKELINYKNEMRKLKQTFKDKEEEMLHEEQQILATMESEYKIKLEESNKQFANEKKTLVELNSEERYKYEQELQTLKKALQEESAKQLAEQRMDFEKELKEHIYQYLKHNQEEVEELSEKNQTLQSEKEELMQQFESEKVSAKRKYDSERYALVETIRKLLKNVMRIKAQRVKLKHCHKDEMNDLEEKFEIERGKLEENCEEEIELLRDNLHRSFRNDQQRAYTYQRQSSETINGHLKYGPIKTKPERESDATAAKSGEKLSFVELQELVQITDRNQNVESVRVEYEDELRRETDLLMNRLLEISDELDTLRTSM